MSPLKWRSAAARRLLDMARVDRIDQAVPVVVSKVLAGIHCPPTDLAALCARLNVTEVLDDDDIPVVVNCAVRTGPSGFSAPQAKPLYDVASQSPMNSRTSSSSPRVRARLV